MEYSTYLIAKSLNEEMDKVEGQIKLYQDSIDNAYDYMKGTEDEKVLKNTVFELHLYLAELKAEFWNL